MFAMLDDLAGRYPDDPGVLVTPLLNYVVLEPGESLFVDAGVIHAYGAGFALEIMASSDNVVRAGLTGKHKDVDELLAITDFSPHAPPPLARRRRVRAHARRESPARRRCPEYRVRASCSCSRARSSWPPTRAA